MSRSHLFRRFHTTELLQRFDPAKGPLDLFVSLYFRHTPQLGSKDRAYVSEMVYSYFRMKGLIDALFTLAKGEGSQDAYWNFALDLLEKPEALERASQDASIPVHDRMSMPRPLYEAIRRSWGEEADALCGAMNRPAPLTIRTNVNKIEPDALLQKLKDKGFPVSKDAVVPEAIHFEKRVALFSLPEFQEGLFEIQDAGSQLIAHMIQAKIGDHVLDYCAGAGGKTLAIAPRMKGQGQIYLHDIRLEALLEAKKRLRRAGIQNVQYIMPDEVSKLKRLHGRMDWVLVDAPCSGTGTLRRNPDMRWKFSSEMLERIVEEQKAILKTACRFIKPSGCLIWATCSILREENEDIVQYAQEKLGMIPAPSVEKNILKLSPLDGVWDGFFAAALVRRPLPE